MRHVRKINNSILCCTWAILFTKSPGMQKIIRTETVAVASEICISSRKAERLAIFICPLPWRIIVHSTVHILRIPICRMPGPVGHLSVFGIITNLPGQDTKVSMWQEAATTLLHKTRKSLPTRPGGSSSLRWSNNPVTLTRTFQGSGSGGYTHGEVQRRRTFRRA